jgi:hypothetical protein
LHTVLFESGSQLHTIGQNAFANSPKLANIVLPNSVTTIGHSAFMGCTGLKQFRIPNSVTAMGFSPFQNWNSTQTITIVGYTPTSLPGGWNASWNSNCGANIVWI